MSWIPYAVGSNQITGLGDQKKHFVSKSTLVYSTVLTQIKFNSLNNVTIDILANTWYEFKCNIHTVYVYDDLQHTAGNHIYFYFEGVMYDEGRRPE